MHLEVPNNQSPLMWHSVAVGNESVAESAISSWKLGLGHTPNQTKHNLGLNHNASYFRLPEL